MIKYADYDEMVRPFAKSAGFGAFFFGTPLRAGLSGFGLGAGATYAGTKIWDAVKGDEPEGDPGMSGAALLGMLVLGGGLAYAAHKKFGNREDDAAEEQSQRKRRNWMRRGMKELGIA